MLMMILIVQGKLSTAIARVKELEAQLVEAQRLLSARGSELQSLTDVAQASAAELLRVRGSILEATNAGCIQSNLLAVKPCCLMQVQETLRSVHQCEEAAKSGQQQVLPAFAS